MKTFTVSCTKGDARVDVVHNDELGRIVSHIFTALTDDCDLEVSDEYHSMHELYQHRMALNIALFNLIEQVSHWDSASDTMFNSDYKVMKSKLHNDGTMFDGYFIVMLVITEYHGADRKYKQVSYHYKLKHWDKFKIPEVKRTPAYDGHTSKEVLERLMKL